MRIKNYAGIVLLLAGVMIWAGSALAFGTKTIVVKGSGKEYGLTPVSISYPHAGSGKKVVVVCKSSGKELPATVRDGELVFLIPSVPAGVTQMMFDVKSVSRKGTPAVQIEQGKGEDTVRVWKKDNGTIDNKVVLSPSHTLQVKINGELFTAYNYSTKNNKPFLWPMLAEGGAHITRDYPMGDKEIHGDHPHQKSFWTAYGNMKCGTALCDTWEEYNDENMGFELTKKIDFGSGDAYGWIVAQNIWTSKKKEPVLDETREYRFYNSPASARFFDVMVKLTASYGDVYFKDTKEGGIVAARIRDLITEKDGGGVITNGSNQVGASQCWGQPSPWCDYSGNIPNVGVRGLAIFDNPANFRHPTCWHVRNYGLMGANCFGYSYFTHGKKNGDFTLKKGRTLVFRYRVYVHSGDVKQAQVQQRYNDYVAPLVAQWSK